MVGVGAGEKGDFEEESILGDFRQRGSNCIIFHIKQPAGIFFKVCFSRQL